MGDRAALSPPATFVIRFLTPVPPRKGSDMREGCMVGAGLWAEGSAWLWRLGGRRVERRVEGSVEVEV